MSNDRFMEKLSDVKVFVIPRLPGIREFERKEGVEFDIRKRKYVEGYVDFCVDIVRKLQLRIKSSNMSSISISKMDKYTKNEVIKKIKKRLSKTSRSDITKWTNLAIKEYLIKRVFGNLFRSAAGFDKNVERLTAQKVINYSNHFPLFNGSIIYPILPLNDHSVFAKAIKGSYEKLHSVKGITYVEIADMRDMVCFRLKIDDNTFDSLLRDAVFLDRKGKYPVSISLDCDIYSHKEYKKRETFYLNDEYDTLTVIWIRPKKERK